MKKQLFIAFLAVSLMATSVPVLALTAGNASAEPNTTPTVANVQTTSPGALTKTDSPDSNANTTAKPTDAAITDSTPNTPTTTSTEAAIKNSDATTSGAVTEILAPVTLSLEAAYKKMLADSPQAILAKYTLDSDLSVAKGYSEKISSLNKAQREADRIASDPNLTEAERMAGSWGIDTSNKTMLQANRTFGNAQAPKNYEASINKLKSQTYEKYYNYKYVETQVQVAKDNLTRAQAIYDSTMLKYKLGTVSRLDTLTVETALNEAKDRYAVAINEFETEKMAFNLFMGYDIHQKVALTDNLVPLTFPTKALNASVQDALANRNEISEANYNAQMAQYALDNVKDYPQSSATYLSAKSVLLMAQETAKTTPQKIEIDVRTKYMDMKQKYDAVSSGKMSYENSKEASRLGQLQYDSGLITVTDLSEINLKTFDTQQAYYKAILDYNLAVDAYNLSSGIGTETAVIK